MDKKKRQLGMNPSTASHRLVKDLLYEYGVVRQHKNCFHCGKPMTREEFSIEHVTPWLDSEDPVGLYFDLNNVDFSHHSCNVAAARRGTKTQYPEYQGHKRKPWQIASDKRRVYCPKKRREQYLRTGK